MTLALWQRMCDDVAVMYAGHIVEYGTLEEVFNNTKHPYTEGLFVSLPNIHKRVEKLHPIQGLMPDPSILPKGCAFAERCPYATDACREKSAGNHLRFPRHTELRAAHTEILSSELGGTV